MTDRELLELAAKAAEIVYKIDAGYVWIFEQDLWTCWNPLEDDGDALRLVVKLAFTVDVLDGYIDVLTPTTDGWRENYTSDPYEATRRAIVRAAAEIGKAMK